MKNSFFAILQCGGMWNYVEFHFYSTFLHIAFLAFRPFLLYLCSVTERMGSGPDMPYKMAHVM